MPGDGILIWGPLRRPLMGVRNDKAVYVDPLPQEYHDSVARFNREVIDRSAEIPKDELRRLVAAQREWERPYVEMENKAMREYLAALAGIDPEEFKTPLGGPGFLAKYFGPNCDSLEMIRSVRGRGP